MKVFEMKKIIINNCSSADSVPGQGVGSAYLEQVTLMKENAKDDFEILVNSKKQADIYHYHTIDPSHFIKMKMKKGIHVAYVHFLPDTLDGSIRLPKFAFNIFKKYVLKFYQSADVLVVVNPTFIQELVAIGLDENKIVYIPNYVSKDKFYKEDEATCLKIREKMGYKKDDFIILGAGQVQTRKGVKDFIEVAHLLPQFQFVWCGGFSFGVITDDYNDLNKIVQNPPKNVKFTGIIPREQMNEMFNMADMLFMPSYNELFPMTILEASNCQKPMLLRDLVLYEDILFGNYLKADNNKTFASIIQQLHDDASLYQLYQQKSDAIAQYYSKEHVYELWKDFYHHIYDKSNRTRS